MKFTITTMTAVFTAAVLALPSPATNQLVTDFEIPPQSPEVLAAFKTLPKDVLSPEKAGNVAVDAVELKRLKARADIFFFVTADINWGGRQENLQSTPGQCYNLQNGWNDQVSSAGPDTGSCTLWENNGCSGSSLGGIRNPGIANLHNLGWGDRASSYRCS